MERCSFHFKRNQIIFFIMKSIQLTFLLFSFVFTTATFSQAEIDTTLNNLVHAANYQTSKWGSLTYEVFGKGKQPMIILPGAGFDASLFRKFMDDHLQDYTMYVITLPGYSGTHAYPMPSRKESYSQQNWINGVMKGILQLIETQGLQRPVLVGHQLISPHIALRLAAEHGEKFSKVIIIGAPAELKSPPPYDTLGHANRVKFTDKYLAPMWFKFVTHETWLNGNFLPESYSLDTIQAKLFWEMANDAPLPVHIEYLCENWCGDFSKYKEAKVPVLVMAPSFQSDILAKTCNSYLESWSYERWQKMANESENLKVVLVEGSACNIMYDQPEKFDQLMIDFLNK